VDLVVIAIVKEEAGEETLINAHTNTLIIEAVAVCKADTRINITEVEVVDSIAIGIRMPLVAHRTTDYYWINLFWTK
jgi:hypothetical protein